MSPSTSVPKDAFHLPKQGIWTCYLCSPPVHDRGEQTAWMAHYLREHYREVKP